MRVNDGVAPVTRRALLWSVAVLPLAAACSTPAPAPAPAPAPVAVPAPTTPPPPVTTRPVAPPTGEVARASTGRPEIALTFHGAGDEELARAVLTALHDRGAAVTVLAVGTWLRQSPDAAKMVTGLGHELGNHTYSHGDVDSMGAASVRTEIERCRDLISAAIGSPGAFFRPSQAQHATPEVIRLAAAAGYPTVLSYDVDSKDFTDPGALAIRRNVASARPGSVVSMHLGHPGTLTAIPGLLDDLAGRGLTPVTATRLFS
ncbi:polysaccharide deacetylase family protein [Pseudonocardia ailaonensis]|uniref:Polysaccharide deacetylase family protein n=1 Tax=Pseudonocardia ailaonensis TaxID=367279 RepID=A0ABN2NCN9_9PSEU